MSEPIDSVDFSKHFHMPDRRSRMRRFHDAFWGFEWFSYRNYILAMLAGVAAVRLTGWALDWPAAVMTHNTLLVIGYFTVFPFLLIPAVIVLLLLLAPLAALCSR